MKKLLISLLALIVYPFIISAQPFNVTIATTGSTGACALTTYNVTITGFTSISDVDFVIENDILVGGTPINSWPCLSGGAINGSFPVLSQINTMVPVNGCSISNSSYTGNEYSFTLTPLSIGATATFSYDVYIDCSAIPGNINTDIDFKQTWNAEVNAIPQTVSIVTPGILNTYTDEAINFPYFDHLSTITEDTYYGAITYLYFEYVNQGTDGNIDFAFENNASACASVYTILETKYDVNGTSYPNNVLASNPVFIAHNDIIRIRQKIQITGCLPCSEPSAVFKWKCDFASSGYNFCSECQEIYTTSVNIVDTAGIVAGLTMARLIPVNNLPLLYGNFGFWDVTCDNDDTHWRISIKNTGNVTLPVSRFSLSHSNWADFVFTSINPNGIIYQYYDDTYTPCSVCLTNQVNPVVITTSGNPFFCAPYPSSLSDLQVNIINLGPGHSVEVEFDAYRCCSDDDALLNHSIGYNQYAVELKYSTACDNDFSTLDYDGTNDQLSPVTPTWDSYGITSNRYSELAGEFNLQLGFTPTITDLSVPQGQTFGADADFSINLNGMFPGSFDHQVLGVQSTLNASTNINAILRAKIHCDKGLRIEALANDVRLMSNLGSTLELVPLCYYKETNGNNCIEDNYYFYYAISTGQDIYNFINNGRLDFRLISCCLADRPATYVVAFHILRDPVDCGLSFACQDSVTPPSCGGCCWIPLSSRGNYINVHCPGCLAPGIIVDSYTLKRTSLGLTDSDNDRIANAPLTQLTTSSIEYPDLNLSFSYHGDDLEDCMVAHFQEGDFTNGGYNYIQIITGPDGDISNELKYLQLQRTFSRKDMMNVVLTGFDFYIEEPAGNSAGCSNCSDCGFGNNFYNTVFQMNLNSGDPDFSTFYPDPSLSNEFFFTFSRADIEAYQLLHGGTFNNGFQENQRYRLVCRYKVCGNHINTLEQCDISNRMWLSSTLKPHDAFGSSPQMPNALPVTNPPFPANWADPYIFYCETFGGIHYFSGLNAYYYLPFLGLHWDGLPWYYGVGGNYTCTPKLRFVTGVSSTVDYFSFYPYEIRIPTIEPYEWQVAAPPGYIITAGRAYSDFNYYDISGFVPAYVGCYSNLTVNNINLGLFPITATTTITLNDLPAINCISDLAQACSPVSTLSVGDLHQKFVFEFDLTISPNSCNPGTSYGPWWGSLTNAKFRDRASLCGIQNDMNACSTLAQTIFCNNPDGQSLSMPNPNLSIDFLPDDIDVSTHQICWEFQISNFTPGTMAYNSFLGVPANNPLFNYLTNWQLSFNGSTIPIDPVTGYFSLGNIPTSPIPYTGTLCAEYTGCVGGGSIPIYWGWNCNNIPITMPPPASVCQSNLVTITLNDIEVNINPTNVSYPPNYSPCNLITEVYAEFTALSPSPYGETYPQEIQFSSVTGLSVNSVTILNCSTGVSVPLTYTIGWFIDPNDLITLFGHSYLQAGECLKVLVTYQPNCNYNGALPEISLVWADYCFDPMIPAVAQFTPSWTMINDGCCFFCDSFSIAYIEKGKCEFSFNAIIPSGLPCSAASTITWDFGDGGTDLGSSVSHQYLTDDIYIVCYTYVCYDGEVPSDSCMVCDTIVVDCSMGLDTFCLKIPKLDDADIGEGIMETSDGGFVLAATLYEPGSGGDRDMYFVKYTSSLSQQYFYRMGDHSPYIYSEDGNSVLVRPDGYFIAGTIYINSADEDVFVAKLRLDGSVEYSYRYSSALPRKEGAYKLIDMSTSTERALLVVGYAELSSGDKNMLALKLDPADLSVMAQNTYWYPTTVTSQEIGYDAVKTGIHTMTDHFAIVGEQYTATNDKNIMVVNIRTDLSLISGKIYLAEKRSDMGYGIAAYSGSLYVTGSSKYSGGNDHLMAMKISAFSLAHQSHLIYAQTSSTIEVGKKIIVDSDSKLVIVGYNDTEIPTSGPDALILKLEPTDALTKIWCKSTNLQPFTERFNDVTQYGTNHYLAVGSFPGGNGQSDEDIFIASIEKDSGYSCCLSIYPIAGKSTIYSTRDVDEKEPKIKPEVYGDSIPYSGDEMICPGGHWGYGRLTGANKNDVYDGLKIYPNPARDEFIIDFMGRYEKSVFNLEVTDVAGRIISSMKVNTDEHSKIKVDSKTYLPGVYFIKISNSSEKWDAKVMMSK